MHLLSRSQVPTCLKTGTHQSRPPLLRYLGTSYQPLEVETGTTTGEVGTCGYIALPGLCFWPAVLFPPRLQRLSIYRRLHPYPSGVSVALAVYQLEKLLFWG